MEGFVCSDNPFWEYRRDVCMYVRMYKYIFISFYFKHMLQLALRSST